MTSSIRPPSSPPTGTRDVEGTSDTAPAEGLEKAPARSVAASATPLSAAPQTEQAQGPTAAWLQRLEAGEVTREQAVEGLLAQALESHGGARLSHGPRQELEQVLRAALLDDPVLSGLLRPVSG